MMKTATLNFTDKEIIKMSLPLFLEQGLVMLVGLADIALVSYAGEAAVSGVALVNQFNIIFVYLFTSLAVGGSVVVSQYLGRADHNSASHAVGQLLALALLLGILLALFVGVFPDEILRLLFSRVDADVFAACKTYLKISVWGYPMLAMYNCGAVIFRCLGSTQTTMYVSGLANLINIIGNFIGIFYFHAGVAGVAWPSIIAITFAALVITVLGSRRSLSIHYHVQDIISLDRCMLRKILRIAIPNSMEQGIAQVVKVALTSIVALFGTVQIAANGVAQSLWSVAALVGVAMRPIFITVIGQCMGAGDTMAAEHYFHRLNKMTLAFSSAWNLLILLAMPFVLSLYHVDAQVKALVFWLVLLHNVFNAFAYPLSSALGSGLRATGDVKFTMYVAISSTVFVRLLLSYLLGVVLGMGVLGVAMAMVCDWCVCGGIYWWRQRSGAWKTFTVLD